MCASVCILRISLTCIYINPVMCVCLCSYMSDYFVKSTLKRRLSERSNTYSNQSAEPTMCPSLAAWGWWLTGVDRLGLQIQAAGQRICTLQKLLHEERLYFKIWIIKIKQHFNFKWFSSWKNCNRVLKLFRLRDFISMYLFIHQIVHTVVVTDMQDSEVTCTACILSPLSYHGLFDK